MNPNAAARAQAIRLLKVRPRSESELRERLSRKGVGPEAVETLLEEFRRKGLVDDAKFAKLFATQRVLSKPMGKRGLMADLKAKGVAPDLAGEAVRQALGGQEEETVARQLAESRLSRLKELPQAAQQRRLYGFLSRRGFSGDTVYKVVREVTAQGGHPSVEPRAGSRESEDQRDSPGVYPRVNEGGNDRA